MRCYNHLSFSFVICCVIFVTWMHRFTEWSCQHTKSHPSLLFRREDITNTIIWSNAISELCMKNIFFFGIDLSMNIHLFHIELKWKMNMAYHFYRSRPKQCFRTFVCIITLKIKFVTLTTSEKACDSVHSYRMKQCWRESIRNQLQTHVWAAWNSIVFTLRISIMNAMFKKNHENQLLKTKNQPQNEQILLTVTDHHLFSFANVDHKMFTK